MFKKNIADMPPSPFHRCSCHTAFNMGRIDKKKMPLVLSQTCPYIGIGQDRMNLHGEQINTLLRSLQSGDTFA